MGNKRTKEEKDDHKKKFKPFFDFMKECRNKSELTQLQAADKLYCDVNTIQNWEGTGGYPNPPDYRVWENIAKVYNIGLEDIMNIYAKCNRDEEKSMNAICRYPFLPDDIIDLKLNKDEIDVLIIRNLYPEKKQDPDFLDLIIKAKGSKGLLCNRKIESISLYEDILWKIVERDGLEKLDIQQLDENDIDDIIMRAISVRSKEEESEFTGWPQLKDLICALMKKECYAMLTPDKKMYCYTGNLSDKFKMLKTLDVDEYEIVLAEYFLTGTCKVYGSKGRQMQETHKYNKNSDPLYRDFYFIPKAYEPYIQIMDIPNESDYIKAEFKKTEEEYEKKMDIWRQEVEKWNKNHRQYICARQPVPERPKQPEYPRIGGDRWNKLHKVCLTFKAIKFMEFYKNFLDVPWYGYDGCKRELIPLLGKMVEAYGTLFNVIKKNGASKDLIILKNVFCNNMCFDELVIPGKITEKLQVGKIYKVTGEVIAYLDEYSRDDFTISKESITEYKYDKKSLLKWYDK